jgi:hypothetical protein
MINNTPAFIGAIIFPHLLCLFDLIKNLKNAKIGENPILFNMLIITGLSKNKAYVQLFPTCVRSPKKLKLSLSVVDDEDDSISVSVVTHHTPCSNIFLFS